MGKKEDPKTHLPLRRRCVRVFRLDGEESIKAALLLGREAGLELVGSLANAVLPVRRYRE